MINSLRLYDIDIRIRLLEYLTAKFSSTEHFIALEAQYAITRRRADVLLISDDIHAFEIKSDADGLDRLPYQLKDYKKSFDFVSIVTTEKYAQKVESSLGKNVGLLVTSEHGIHNANTPRRNLRITKKNMISMCSRATLKSCLKNTARSLTLDEIHKRAEKSVPLPDLRELAISELKRRFKPKFEAFKEEARVPYRKDDLSVLQHNQRLQYSLITA